MSNADVVIFFAGLSGICVFLIGIAIANVAVFRMQKALNQQEEPDKRVSPWLVIGKGSFKYHPVLKYEAKFGDGPLPRLRRFASWLMLPGALVGFGCLLIERVRIR